MKKLISFIIILSFFTFEGVSQESTYRPSSKIEGSYLGSVLYPGFKIGIERPFLVKEVKIFKVKKVKIFYRENYLNYNLGMYHHKTLHTNFFAQAQWVRRKQKSKGYFHESVLGLGVSQTILDGATYKVNDNGQVSKIPMAGNRYALVSGGFSLGYNLNMKHQKPYSFFIKHQWLLLFPFNQFIYARPTLELGCSYHIKGLWDGNPLIRTKERKSFKFKKSQNSALAL